MPRTLAAALLSLLALAAAAPALAGERADIPAKYTWNLKELYPSDAAWVAGRDALRQKLPALGAHRGHLGDSAEALAAALEEVDGFNVAWTRLAVYASARADEDTRDPRAGGMRDEANQLGVDFGAAVSYLKPELLVVGAERIAAFRAAEKRLAPYGTYLDDALRWKAHTLSAAEESIAAQAGNLSSGGNIYGLLKDADIPWPEVQLSTGKVRLDNSSYTLHRAAPLAADRDLVFDAFFRTFKTYERTFGATLSAQVKADLFDAKVHHFASALEAALFPNNIPPAVYKQLIADVHRSLPTLHRYLKLRQRMLGLATLRYQDLYMPLVAKVDMDFTPEQAMALTLEAVKPLGPEYGAALQKGFESRWTDFLPSTGKRPGAYSTGVWGVHPYQLLNFNGKYEDLTTLAHEAGHSMHTWLAITTQPSATADYPIFVAEVASTLNENLLLHFMLGRAKDDATRLTLLGTYLDGARTTLFRQALFADFELRIHEMAERDEALTGDKLSALYLQLLREYYGHDQGVCRVDQVMETEWAYIPHFYRDFYVFQYATSLVNSTALAQAIRADEAKGRHAARDRYLAMLKAGGSRFPIDLLRDAGVDPTTSAPFDAAMAQLNQVMDEMEKILTRQPKPKAKTGE
jgi:oligoendopeptidase F